MSWEERIADITARVQQGQVEQDDVLFLLARVERLEGALKLVKYVDKSRGYPTGTEWKELAGVVDKALEGE